MSKRTVAIATSLAAAVAFGATSLSIYGADYADRR
jgi:hypothetical protein